MKPGISVLLFSLVCGFCSIPAFSQGPSGSVEFVASAAPSGGLDEPVRGFPFYLLSKSFDEISREVEAAYPKPDMDAFIDKLEVSPELKAWMKKNRVVQFSGEDFIHLLKVPDVVDVPEFYQAYLDRNSGDQSQNFPKPKYKYSDKVKAPARYEKLKADYAAAVRRYMEQFPESINGIDLNLAKIDPSNKWKDLAAKRDPEIHRMALDLAQSKYLVARAQTDLQGEAVLHGVPPGNYWLSTLDMAASVGDARPRWDTSVTVRPGQQVHVALSNVNAVESASSHSAP
jgi:hypothetical protein